MILPQEIIDTIFSWIDVSFIYEKSYYINYDVDELFKNAYLTSGSIGRATKLLFLKKKHLFKTYSIQFMIYKNISLTSTSYSNYDKYKDTFDNHDINLMIMILGNQCSSNPSY